MRRTLPVLALTLVACAKQVAPEPPKEVLPQGWHRIDGHLCYEPPSFANVSSPQEQRTLRGRALSEATARWRGRSEPAFSMPSDLVDSFEAVMLASPDRIERVLPEDFAQCTRWAKGELTLEAYESWMRDMLDELRLEDCTRPPFELVTQYIEVDRRWQIETQLCRDEQVFIRAVGGDYTVEFKGDDASTSWITAPGDRSAPTLDPAYPCHVEGCYRGQLIARFVDRKGRETVFPVGQETTFSAPAHGTLTFSVNDADLYDNRFRVHNGVTEFMLVEVRPATPGKGN